MYYPARELLNMLLLRIMQKKINVTVRRVDSPPPCGGAAGDLNRMRGASY